MKRLLHVSFLALTALLAAGATARADINWTYSWSNTPAVLSDVPASMGGGGTITLSQEGNPTPVSATNSNPVVAANLRVISTATSTNPDLLHTNGAVNLDVTITDLQSGKTHTFNFAGKLGGFFSANQAGVTFAMTGPTQQSFSFNEGGGIANTYTVTFTNYTQPGPTQSHNQGAIGFQVDVGSAKITGNMPEPTSMLLSVLGASFAGFSSWRLRRRRAALAA
jgi:hypothetical protein